jgi:hypothetical protein
VWVAAPGALCLTYSLQLATYPQLTISYAASVAEHDLDGLLHVRRCIHGAASQLRLS